MAKTPIYNSQICLWKVIVTGCTEYFRLQGTTMYCNVLGFTGVYWGDRVQGGFWLLQGIYWGILGGGGTGGFCGYCRLHFFYERKIIPGGLFGGCSEVLWGHALPQKGKMRFGSCAGGRLPSLPRSTPQYPTVPNSTRQYPKVPSIAQQYPEDRNYKLVWLPSLPP